MATGMREKTTNVGGVIKRIWYAMTGTTQGAELMSIDDTGKFKCVSEQITGLAGTGNRMVIADSTGNLNALNNTNIYSRTQFSGSASSAYCKIGHFAFGAWNSPTVRIKISKGSYDTCVAECNMLISCSARSIFTSTRVRWNGTFTNDTGYNSIRVFLNAWNIEIYAKKNTGFSDVFFNIEYGDSVAFTPGTISDITLPSSGEIMLTATADDKGV